MAENPEKRATIGVWPSGVLAKENNIPVSEELDLFLMANLSPRLTGLPVVAWISSRGNARQDVRVKVSPGPRAKPEEMIEADMPATHLELLSRWVALNRDVLIR